MRKFLAAIAACLFVLSGCANTSGSDEDAKQTLVNALRNLLEAEAITETITVDSDVDSLVAVSEGEIDEEVASTILESSLTASGTQAENPADASSSVVLDVAGSEDFEMRFVAGDLYVRAEVRNLFGKFGQDRAEFEALAAQVKGQKGFEWAEEALAGKWIVVRDAIALTQQFGGTTASAEQQKKLINDLLETVEQNASVTSEGEDDAGEHLAATLPMRKTLQDLVESLGPAAGMAGGMQASLEEIPNEDVVIDFWIADESVNRLSLDVTQFEEAVEESGDKFPEGVERLAIVIEFSAFDGKVEPVSDAVEVDTAALSQAFSGLMTGGAGMGGAPPGSSFDCSMLKGAAPEVIELYAKECPELQK